MPIVGGSNDDLGVVPYVTTRPHFSTLDSIGVAYVAGETYYDYQHNGSSGHMVSVDSA